MAAAPASLSRLHSLRGTRGSEPLLPAAQVRMVLADWTRIPCHVVAAWLMGQLTMHVYETRSETDTRRASELIRGSGSDAGKTLKAEIYLLVNGKAYAKAGSGASHDHLIATRPPA